MRINENSIFINVRKLFSFLKVFSFFKMPRTFGISYRTGLLMTNSLIFFVFL